MHFIASLDTDWDRVRGQTCDWMDGRDKVGGRTNGKGGGWNFHPPETYKKIW